MVKEELGSEVELYGQLEVSSQYGGLAEIVRDAGLTLSFDNEGNL